MATDPPVAAVDFLDRHPGDLAHLLALDADHGFGQLADHFALLVLREDSLAWLDDAIISAAACEIAVVACRRVAAVLQLHPATDSDGR